MNGRRVVAGILVAWAAWSSPVQAAPARPATSDGRIVHRSLIVARLNPLGLLYEGRISYRRSLYDHDALALRDNFFAVGLAPSLSPAYGKLGAVVEFQPLSVLQLWGMYEVQGYLGTFNHLQSFESADAGYDDTTLQRNNDLPPGDPRRPYTSTGTQLTLGATVQAKVGPVAARSQLRFVRPDMRLREDDAYFYDITYDVLAENRAWFMTNDLDVLYQSAFGLTAGVRWNMTQAFYSAEDDPTMPTHRVGPLLAYTFFTREGVRFNTPTVLLIANWWLTHPYRTGADVSQAFPYLALGFAFTGDLLPR